MPRARLTVRASAPKQASYAVQIRRGDGVEAVPLLCQGPAAAALPVTVVTAGESDANACPEVALAS